MFRVVEASACPKHLLHHLGVDAARDHQGSARVPEAVEGHGFGESGALEQRDEALPVKRPAAHRSARRVREHQAVVLPEAPEPKPLLVLGYPVAFEGFEGFSGELHVAASRGGLGFVVDGNAALGGR
jgi:hypothetical protein